MKYRTLAVLAFAGVLAVSGAAFAKENDPNDPFKRDPFAEIQRVREKNQEQTQESNYWPDFRPGTYPTRPRPNDDSVNRPSRFPEDKVPPKRPSDQQNGTKPDRRPPKVDGKRPPENSNNSGSRTPPPHRPHSRDRRPPERRK